MFPGVDTSRFISFIRKLVHDKSNILICEGISSVLCNISVLKQIQMIGYKLHIIELTTPLDECIHNLIRRNDYTIKTKKMIRAWQKKRIEIQDSFIVYQLSQEEAKIFLLHSVHQVKNRDLEKNVKICFNTTNSFEVTLQKVKSTLYSIDLKSQQLKNKNKNWMFQFHIGRTVTRFQKEFKSCEVNMWNSKNQVNMMDVKYRLIPDWKKDLYYSAYQLIKEVDKRWTGEKHDLVIQFACMDTNSYVCIHSDKDVSSQFVMSFGEYSGGELMLFDEKSKTFKHVETKNHIVQFDGRFKHYVTKVTNGLRHSIVFYKMFDRRYNEQPYFTGVKTYQLY